MPTSSDTHTLDDGSIDADYAWGRPVSAYLSTLDHMRLLLFRARYQTQGAANAITLARPC